MNDDVLERNDSGDLEVRVVNSTGDNGTDVNDVFTRDDEGRLALRTVGGGSGGGTGGLTSVSHDNTLEGRGTSASPLKVAAKITAVIPDSATAGNQLVTEYDLMQHSELPPQTGNAGKVLSTNGATPEWIDAPGGTVVHDDTLSGSGTTENPLSVIKPAAIIREW